MANNLDILDGAGATKTVKTTDNASVHTPHHNVDTLAAVTAFAPSTGATSILKAEDAASAGGDALVGVAAIRLDTPVTNANVSADGDYTQLLVDNMGKLWTADVQKEDAASGDGDRGSAVLAVRKATPANTSGSDGDYEFLQMSAGRLWVSATVDAALPAGTNGIGKLTANSGVDIGDVDVTSLVPGTTATSLGKAEDAGHTTGDTGVMMLGVRQNTAASLAGSDADYVPPIMNTRGALWVSIEDGAGGQITSFGGGTQYTEDAAAASDPVGTMAMMRRRDTLTSSEVSADGDNIAPNATSRGEQYVHLEPRAGGIAKAEDVASADGDVGVGMLAVRKATPANTSGADGDYEFAQISIGHLWVAPPPITKASSNFNRPGDTTAYAALDAVANNTTAGSVTLLSWSIGRSSGIIRRVRIKKSDQTVATPTIRLWLYDTTLTPAAGDNAAFSHPATDSLGYVDVPVTTAGTDDAVGWSDVDIPFTGAIVYGLLQTLTAFTPANAETFTVDIWYLPG